ncbi:MAG: hypothetical protein ACE5R6_00835 [Candidatus Heimdallarchaeota archaeon]
MKSTGWRFLVVQVSPRRHGTFVIHGTSPRTMVGRSVKKDYTAKTGG